MRCWETVLEDHLSVPDLADYCNFEEASCRIRFNERQS